MDTISAAVDKRLHLDGGGPLRQGANQFSLAGVDTHGQPISGDSNNVAVVYNGTVPSPVGQVVLNENHVQPIGARGGVC